MGHNPVRALDGIRIFELSIAIAAPSAGRTFAFHGAEVIKIESRNNPDVARLFGSVWARVPEHADIWTDSSPYIPEMSAGKLSVGLDLKHPDGLAVAKELLAQCDVLLTNYSSPAVKALGLAYEDTLAVKEDLIYVALPGFGSSAELPYYEFLAWGPNQAPLVGLDAVTGYADQEPAGIAAIAPPDYLAGKHAMLAILAALEHRDATGEGCFVDISQFETTVSLLGPYLFDYDLTGNVPERAGSRTERFAPQGVYPTRGNDRWVAISVVDDAMWTGLGRAAHGESWAADPRFATVEGRLAHHDELDELIGGWTAGHKAEEVAAWLQEQGVAAHAVLDHVGVLLDPQIRAREWFQVRPCHRFERDLFGSEPLRLTDTPGGVDVAGPSVGEHTVSVLGALTGRSEQEVVALAESGAAFLPAAPDKVVKRPYDAYLSVFGLLDGAVSA